MSANKNNQYSSLQQRIWRWHFYAGLMVVPFAILLAITGSVYLFNPQYEAIIEKRINANAVITNQQQSLPADQLLSKTQAQYPAGQFKKWIVAKEYDRSAEIEIKTDDGIYIIWVDTITGDILHQTLKSSRLMQFMKKLHGELLLKSQGSLVVEFMASWMIILLITGIFLWWPRRQPEQTIVGNILQALLPNIPNLNTRQGWRQLHGTIGIWASILILVLLFSGLPWTQVWGEGFKRLQGLMGWDGPGQEWFVTLQSSQPNTDKYSDGFALSQLSDEKTDNVTLDSQKSIADIKPISLQTILDKITLEPLAHPIEVYPPRGDNGVWTVRSMTQNRPLRKTLHYDRWTGEEIMRITFQDYHPVKQLTAYGIALHEGALFGIPNQLLGLATALSVIVLSASGVIMWWQRRPAGKLAAPKKVANYSLSITTSFTILIVAVFLPMVALSLVTIAIIEIGKLFIRRITSAY